jgi:predicted DNA-binding transcriptional regulator AlpA
VAKPVTMETIMETLSVPQAATYTNLSKSSLDKLRVYGGGPLYIKVGARVVYDRIDLDTWLIGRKIANTSQAIAVAS